MSKVKIAGVLHVHTSHSSDGMKSVKDHRDFCLANGISFACITDHAEDLTASDMAELVRECAAASDSSFTAIPGLELRVTRSTHILAIGLKRLPELNDWPKTLEELKSERVLRILAHPLAFNNHPDEKILESIDGIEIWNGSYDGGFFPDPAVTDLYHNLVKKNARLLAFGGTDHHKFGEPLRVKVLVKGCNSYESIMTALAAGEFEVRGQLWRVASRPKKSSIRQPALKLSYGAYWRLVQMRDLIRRSK